MKNNLIHFIQETLRSNRYLQTTLLIYSCILVLIGSQLPEAFYLWTQVVFTTGFSFWMVTYSRWNNSQEFLKTLPSYKQHLVLSRSIAALLISFPFYSMSLLALWRKLTFDRGEVEPMLQFTVKSVVVLLAYIVVYQTLVPKEKTAKSISLMRVVRTISLIVFVVCISLLLYAHSLNSGFYDSIPMVKNPNQLVPQSYTDDYSCENPDKLIVNVHVTQFYEKEKISYASHQIIDFSKSKRFKTALNIFPDCPKRFENIVVYSDGKKLRADNFNAVMNANHSSYNYNQDLQPTKVNRMAIYSKFGEEQFQDPWFRKLFTIVPFSLRNSETVELEFIPYNSTEGTKATAVENKRKSYIYNSREYDQNHNYLKAFHSKLNKSVQKQKQVTFHNYQGQYNPNKLKNFTITASSNLRTLLPRNYLPLLKNLYALLLVSLICGCTAVNFKPFKTYAILLTVLSCFIFIDRSLTDERLQTLKLDQTEKVRPIIAASDLNHTVYWREYTAEKLKKHYDNVGKSNSYTVQPHYKLAYCMLSNRPNKIANAFEDSQGYYDLNHDGKIDIYGEYFLHTPRGNLAKLYTVNGYYNKEYNYQSAPIVYTENNYFALNKTEIFKYHRSLKELDAKVQKIRQKPKEQTLATIKNDPTLYAYLLLRKCHVTVEKIMGKGYVPKIDEVIEIDEAKQLELVLEYLNRDKK